VPQEYPLYCIALLKALFADYAVATVTKHFTEGQSGTFVFLVKPSRQDGQNELPVIVKIGPSHVLEQEWRAAQDHIASRLPGFVPISGQLASVAVTAADGGTTTYSAARYQLAGDGIFAIEMLRDYAHMASADALWTVLEKRLFQQLDQIWNSLDPLIEAITIIFMLIAGMNFATHFLALSKRTYEPYRQDWEASWFLTAMIVSSLAVAIFLWLSGTYPSLATALRYAAFNVISIGTTTGYASTDYNLWPMFVPVLMLLLCATASSAGSTGGGIKMIRTQLLLLQAWRELSKLLHPNAVIPVRLSGQVIPNQIVFSVLAFMSLYGASIIVMTMLMLASGLDLTTSFSAVIACITSTGPGLNKVGPTTTYASLSDFQIWVLSLAMLLGRLEIFTVMVIFTPAFWRR
jgi:hypothetical protein